MPAIKKLSEEGTDMRALMRQSAFAALSADETDFFVDYAVRTLEKHAEGHPRARVFVHALQAIAQDEAEWQRTHRIVQAALSAEAYAQVSAELVDMGAWGEGAYPPGQGPLMNAAGRGFCFSQI